MNIKEAEAECTLQHEREVLTCRGCVIIPTLITPFIIHKLCLSLSVLQFFRQKLIHFLDTSKPQHNKFQKFYYIILNIKPVLYLDEERYSITKKQEEKSNVKCYLPVFIQKYLKL